MKKIIYMMAVVACMSGALTGCEELMEPENTVPTIDSLKVLELSTDYVSVAGYSRYQVTSAYFKITSSEGSFRRDANRSYSHNNYIYSANAEELSTGTTYTYQLFFSGNLGTVASEVGTFTTETKWNQKLTWNAPNKDTYYVGDTLKLNPKASSGLTVSLTVKGSAMYSSVENKDVILRGSGDITITASQDGNNYYNRAEPLTVKLTVKGEGSYDGHEYVDLGLPSGTKWATYNVGTDTPEGSGNYYAWGEVTTKSSYYSSNGKWMNTSYSTLKELNVIDENGNLNPKYDAARVNFGENWRMPTDSEARELHKSCEWITLTNNGITGCMVVGPNGKAIFLPAAGRYWGSSGLNKGYGWYWTSTPMTGDFYKDDSYYMEVFGYYGGVYWVDRLGGFTIRAVYDAAKKAETDVKVDSWQSGDGGGSVSIKN